MSAIKDLIYEFNGMCGRSSTEMGDAAADELSAKDAALEHLKKYFEENHAERIKYPEYLEFHEYKMILDALKAQA